MVSINRTHHVNLGASLIVVAAALTAGCPFDPRGTGPLVEIIPCAGVAECDDANPCTIDTCEEAVCKHTNDDAAAAPDDEEECTIDACVGGMVSHAPSAEGAPCDNAAKVCDATGQCVACSGAFGCDAGEICFEETTCVPCMDHVQNGGETSVDCGGPDCAGCPDGGGCVVDSDCASERCSNGTCTSCIDGAQNGGETGEDCGGPDCGKCNGEACTGEDECKSTFCTDGVCCDGACNGSCVSCDLPGGVGRCNLVPTGSDDNDPLCPVGTTCSGGDCVADQGKGHFGDACANDGQCFNGGCHAGTCRLNEGDPCAAGGQCESGTCSMDNKCAAAPGP